MDHIKTWFTTDLQTPATVKLRVIIYFDMKFCSFLFMTKLIMYQCIWNFTLCVVQSEFLLLYKYHPRFFLFSSTFYIFDFKVWNKRSFFDLFPLHSSPNHAFFFRFTVILNILFWWNFADIPSFYMFATTVLFILGFCSLFHCSFLPFIILSSFPNFPFETSFRRCLDKISGSRLWYLSAASRRHFHMHTRQTPLSRNCRCYKSTNPG